MTSNVSAPTGIEARRQQRSSLFVAAVLGHGAEQAPVKVRNMSPSGAMIELPLAPPAGTQVYLVRGVLIAYATVIWSSHNRCGLRFFSEVSVKEWLAAPTRAEQHRVDEVVALIKAGAFPPNSIVSVGPNAPDVSCHDAQSVDDLVAVVSLIQDLESDLASSEETVARHWLKLQNLDIAMQMIRAIASNMTSVKASNLTSTASLEDLRTACAEALRKRSS